MYKYIHGGYGITVITEVCGTSNSGSIPDSHPRLKNLTIYRMILFLLKEVWQKIYRFKFDILLV